MWVSVSIAFRDDLSQNLFDAIIGFTDRHVATSLGSEEWRCSLHDPCFETLRPNHGVWCCAGRTGRAGATGRATSLYTDRDSFLVAQIKRAMQVPSPAGYANPLP